MVQLKSMWQDSGGRLHKSGFLFIFFFFLGSGAELPVTSASDKKTPLTKEEELTEGFAFLVILCAC